MKGYMGSKMNAMMEVGTYKNHFRVFAVRVSLSDYRISRNWLGMPELAEPIFSLKARVHEFSKTVNETIIVSALERVIHNDS